MEIRLTKDAEKMLGLLYKEFLSRRKEGMSKFDASQFGAEYFAQTKPFSEMHSTDIIDTQLELLNNGMLEMCLDGDCILTTEAIYYLETRFQRGLKDVLSFLANFVP